jgi:hypothetical protein
MVSYLINIYRCILSLFLLLDVKSYVDTIIVGVVYVKWTKLD